MTAGLWCSGWGGDLSLLVFSSMTLEVPNSSRSKTKYFRMKTGITILQHCCERGHDLFWWISSTSILVTQPSVYFQ